MTKKERAEKEFDVSLQTRNFEIELFWKRSTFFWAFVTVAFGGYGALRQIGSDFSIVIACFGMVCAFAWSLLNRGSKYWQETWETRTERSEIAVIGKLFSRDEPVQMHKGCWLRARRYSVSKLTTALSDYIFMLWAFVVTWELLRRYAPSAVLSWLKEWSIILAVAFSVGFLLLLLFFGHSSERPSDDKKLASMNG